MFDMEPQKVVDSKQLTCTGADSEAPGVDLPIMH